MRNKVIKTFCRVMNIAEDQVNESTTPQTVTNWDSIRNMNLILALEEDLGVGFTDDQVMKMLSVGEIIKTVEEIKKG